MIKKTVSYKDPFDNSERMEDLYFHLTAAELLEMQLDRSTVAGAMIARLRERAEQAEKEGISVEEIEQEFSEEDIPKLFEVIKKFVVNGYGERTSAGRHRKSQEIREEFVASEAYSVLIMELCSNAEKGAEFINGMVPADLSAQVAKMTGTPTPTDPRPLMVVPEPRKVTREELIKLPAPDFDKINEDLKTGKAVLVIDGDEFKSS